MDLELTILEAAEKFPNSKSHCFSFTRQNPKVYYFTIDAPQFHPPGSNIRCSVKCLKFHPPSGYLVITNVPIKLEDDLEEYTIKEFADMVMAKVEELKLSNDLEKLRPYEVFGFYKRQE